MFWTSMGGGRGVVPAYHSHFTAGLSADRVFFFLRRMPTAKAEGAATRPDGWQPFGIGRMRCIRRTPSRSGGTNLGARRRHAPRLLVEMVPRSLRPRSQREPHLYRSAVPVRASELRLVPACGIHERYIAGIGLPRSCGARRATCLKRGPSTSLYMARYI